MNLAQAVVEAYKRKWSYINNFSVTIGFANEETAKGILTSHRALEVDNNLMPIKEIISLIDEL